jgi:hypothetical protein
LGVGREQEEAFEIKPPADPIVRTPPHSSPQERTAADAHLSPAEAGTPGISSQNGLSPPTTIGASAGVLPLDLSEGFMPTAAGLYDMTVELWGLPTMEDCEVALRSREVERLLTGVQWFDAARWQVKGGREEAKTVRSEQAKALMRELDRTTAYKNWLVMFRLFEAWEAEGE